MNIICDVAGQLEALETLVSGMPKDDVVLVGDLVDRGPDSKGVIEWAMQNAETVLMGNHEHMMLDWLQNTGIYDEGLWHMNGGYYTMNSYGAKDNMSIDAVKKLIPVDHLAWLKALPTYLDRDGWMVTHAPIDPAMTFEQCLSVENMAGPQLHSVIWNRGVPERIPGKIQVSGHNSMWGYREFKDSLSKEPWGYCLDTTADKLITGINTKTMELFAARYPQTKKEADH